MKMYKHLVMRDTEVFIYYFETPWMSLNAEDAKKVFYSSSHDSIEKTEEKEIEDVKSNGEIK